jgi:hypothetical protein
MLQFYANGALLQVGKNGENPEDLHRQWIDDGGINVGCDNAVRKVIISHIPEAEQYFRGHQDNGRWDT